MFFICGDAHMIAIDDGSHGDFATVINNGSRFPLFNAGALNQTGSYKGGTFSEGGYFSNPSTDLGQFGLITVTDTGGNDICISMDGYRCDSTGAAITYLVHYDFCRTLIPNTTGVNEVETFSSTATVFPNPTNGKFAFKAKENLMDSKIKVSDVLGNEINSNALYLVNFDQIQFDLSSLSAGTYFINVRTKDNVYKKKVVIR
jgi:hypothetical protein